MRIVDLFVELNEMLMIVNSQIDTLKRQSVDQGLDVYSMIDRSGNLVFAPLMQTKVTILHAMTMIQVNK